jgi:hypothetical protein
MPGALFLKHAFGDTHRKTCRLPILLFRHKELLSHCRKFPSNPAQFLKPHVLQLEAQFANDFFVPMLVVCNRACQLKNHIHIGSTSVIDVEPKPLLLLADWES